MSKHKCSHCGRIFKSNEEFNDHARRNTPKPQEGESFEAYKIRIAGRPVCPQR